MIKCKMLSFAAMRKDEACVRRRLWGKIVGSFKMFINQWAQTESCFCKELSG